MEKQMELFDEGGLRDEGGEVEPKSGNEVRSQRLMQFLQVASNQALAPFAKFQYVIREIAKSLDLDPDKVTNNMDEATLQAEIMKKFQQPPEAPTPPAGADAQDPTGAGGATIGTGQVPLPQEQGFSGNEQQQPSQQPTGQATQPTEATGQQQGPMGQLQ